MTWTACWPTPSPYNLQANNRVLAEFGIHMEEEEFFNHIGLDIPAFWRMMKERHDLGPSVDELVDRAETGVIEILREGIVPLPGVPECVTGLLMRGLRLGAASASPRRVVETILDELGLSRTFIEVNCADDVERPKPDPAVYLKTVDALGVDPADAMAVEDSPTGLPRPRAAPDSSSWRCSIARIMGWISRERIGFSMGFIGSIGRCLMIAEIEGFIRRVFRATPPGLALRESAAEEGAGAVTIARVGQSSPAHAAEIRQKSLGELWPTLAMRAGA